MSEIKRALRSVARTPLFSCGVALIFALGIGVNVAVFSAIDRVLFRPLPYDHPERLFVMRQFRGPDMPDDGLPAIYAVRARQAAAVEELTLTNWDRYEFRLNESSDDAKYFGFVPMAYTALKTLGVRPLIGSDFTEEDAKLKRRRVLITFAMWQGEFGGRLDVLGRRIWGSSPDMVYEIAGVLPRDFIPPQLQATEGWSGVALTWHILDETNTVRVFTPPVVRLRQGVSQEQAQAQIDVIVSAVGPEFPARRGVPASFVRLMPLRDAMLSRYADYVWLVFIAATAVLLVTCANLATLFALRARSREHRTAIQIALGASRTQITNSAISESLVLAGVGCAVAMLALSVARDAIAVVLPPTFTSYVAPLGSGRIVGFTLSATLASALLSAALPAWRLSRLDPLEALQRSAGRSGSSRVLGTSALVAFEVALSVVLVFAAILTGRTLANVRAADLGFQPAGLLTVSAYLPPSTDRVTLLRQYEEMLDILRRSPGVQSAAGADSLPMIGVTNRPMFAGAVGTQRCPATDGLVETLGIEVLAGRTLTSDEVRTNAPVGLLSREGLKFLWPGVNPEHAIGRFLEFPGESPREVVGVVSDVRQQYLAPTMPSLYVPVNPQRFGGLLFAARSNTDVDLLRAHLSREFRSRGLAPRSVLVKRIQDGLAASSVNQIFRARLFAGFGLAALFLAVIGIYAVQSFAITLRRTEFSIRLSLGATPVALQRAVFLDTLRPVGTGIVIGLITVYWCGQFLEAFLYGVEARDPWVLVAVSVLLIGVAVIGALLPARSAARTDAVGALRN